MGDRPPWTSRRARCSVCHSCCYKGSLNPSPEPSPIPPCPQAAQLLWFLSWGCWGQMAGQLKAPAFGPPMLPFLLKAADTSSHPPPLSSDHTLWQIRKQVPGQVPGETKHREKPTQKTKTLISAFSSTEPAKGRGVYERLELLRFMVAKTPEFQDREVKPVH